MEEELNMNDYLWRLGTLKENRTIVATWADLAKILNKTFFDEADYKDESFWRKHFKTLQQEGYRHGEQPDEDDALISFFAGVEAQRVRARDERIAKARNDRAIAREDALLNVLTDEIRRYEPNDIKIIPRAHDPNERAVCALLSDVHYGISYYTPTGAYDPLIAEARILKYAEEICKIGQYNNAHACYVSLIGDLISGLIHTTIRIENKENVIQQTVHMSEIVCEFIHRLSQNFDDVYVTSTNGNHSRLTFNKDDALNGERLDAIVPWYCKAKFEQIPSVHFIDGKFDTYSLMNIFGKNYASVHGDMDKDAEKSIAYIEKAEDLRLEAIFAAHLHKAEGKFGQTDFIRNGCVCSSGDEHCIRNRLHGIPVQIVMIMTNEGIQSIHPIKLT